MDYIEEQHNEIEALDSIYCGEMEILATEPHYKFKIGIHSEEYEPETENGLGCSLKFIYTPSYPDEPLEVEIVDNENFDEDQVSLLQQHIEEQIQENLGMVMVFTLVSAAQEWLNARWDEIKKEREEARVKKIYEAEEEERKKFEGTRVTVESFLAWKRRFESETMTLKKHDKEDKDNKKLTGKELFLQDKTLNESDLKFLEEGEETVKVDESLFQDLDDLELDDELDDLEDEDDS